ncbi:trimeric intracellular cation channel family protein [Gynurincola endophyticus]|jgi:uncharacterized membrane protein YeiH|uniref:trimeric intracellular cation channel family protein n=1 Tax=Gynurincola endophyticus TaxID=2479004 RepID=UPI000F8CB842|nr:trimeric intracellular cation channel family protein [Gynurincola endophyticus]
MDYNTFFFLIEFFGTIAFALSGALHAMEKKLDPFGVIIIAFVTSIGGGTLRDMLIGNTPVTWLQNGTMSITILCAAIGAFFLRKYLRMLSKTLFLFDSLGLGLFTVIGFEKGMQLNLSPGICIALGTITGCFGGVTRDVLLNNVPLIFHKEIYASACIIGGVAYYLMMLLGVNDLINTTIVIGIIVFIRVVAVRFKLRLPNFY